MRGSLNGKPYTLSKIYVLRGYVNFKTLRNNDEIRENQYVSSSVHHEEEMFIRYKMHFGI